MNNSDTEGFMKLLLCTDLTKQIEDCYLDCSALAVLVYVPGVKSNMVS